LEEDSSLIQLALSETALTCFLDSIIATEIGLLNFDIEKVRAFYDDQTISLTSGWISDKFGISVFKEKLGSDHDLQVMIKITNPEVEVGKFNRDLFSHFIV